MADGDSDEALARAIAAQRWGACDAVGKLGEGSNNVIFRAEGRGEKTAVKLCKPHRADLAPNEYRKEAWCTAEARVRGVRTPQVLEFGMFEERPFAVLELAEGQAPSASQELSVWHSLGKAARCIHEISVSGWGLFMDDAGVFRESWQKHLDYNIASLNSADPLLALGVLDAGSSQRVLRTLEQLRASPFRFGLCHGDIAPQNVLVDGGEEPWLLDWGSASVHVVPHYEINEILRGPAPAPAALAAFLDGYGMSQSEYDAMTANLIALSALREVDTLRWAIDRKPDMIEEMSTRAKRAVAKLE